VPTTIAKGDFFILIFISSEKTAEGKCAGNKPMPGQKKSDAKAMEGKCGEGKCGSSMQ
jgi:uncharacterized low-complexity protein